MSHRKRCGWIMVAVAALATQGCASRDRWIDCDLHLVPINSPAPLASDEAERRTDDKAHAHATERER